MPTNTALSNQVSDLIEKLKSIPNGPLLKKEDLLEHEAVQELVQTFGDKSKAWNMLYNGVQKGINFEKGESSG
ncbi:hypothetical protein RAF13_27060, partial [Klebsiella pneumoniae]